MKTNQISMWKAITVLMLLFSASVIKAQSAGPFVAPYPHTEAGQELTIGSTHEAWGPLMEASSECRAAAFADIAGGQEPVSRPTCNQVVCCETKRVDCDCAGHPHTGHWRTICVLIGTGYALDIEQW